MSPELDRILEGALLAAGEPLSLERLEGLFDEGARPERRLLREALDTLHKRLEGSALRLEETASGYRLRVDDALSPWVSRLWEERPQRYSRALLETLALIAYRQPVTRGDIEDVRGVSVSSSIMRTLSERGWIRVIGHREMPGRPAVYATTRAFLDAFGLKTLDELPPMQALREGETADWLEQLVATEPEAEQEGSSASESEQGAASSTAQEKSHAATASERTGLSLADIGDRFAQRVQTGDDTTGDASETPVERDDTLDERDTNTSEQRD
ncbi:SMC-Scp complex subunit ScpB [Kushneria phosphatilytica]|uniref:SMC-Scp complex subunit ScpB n=1 Tax=Kushneria phosphatilytica TaxID=657387 RepID=A0A1S1NZL1_9GAMM|nr:SMC-Scp complex subunit ScpB [Kushneria phosphatilytica]OHV13956.1 SMC-Scp complex subunit ScpB [Kushneria phosphatilytica]QEL10518.1 SMC-Scp complex subunit ScpB [Kushneria phosphatilytica]